MSDIKEQLSEVVDTYNEELARLQRELNEIDVMVRQNASDVEKLAQREMSVSTRLRDLEVNLEKYGKPEIKNFYTTAQEVQMRLQMMRAQLEQLQLKQGNMKERYDLISEFVDLVNELRGSAAELGVGSGGGKDHSTNGSGGAQVGRDIIVNTICSTGGAPRNPSGAWMRQSPP